jgi:hypothetical protein
VIFAKQRNSFQLNAGKYLVWVFCSGILQAVFDATELASLGTKKRRRVAKHATQTECSAEASFRFAALPQSRNKASMRNVALTAASHSVHCTDQLLVCFGSLQQIPNQLRLALQ